MNLSALVWSLVLLLSLTTPTSVHACSCPFIYEPFEVQFDTAQYMDAVYITGQVKVVKGRFAGYVDPKRDYNDIDINEDIYYLAYIWKSYKGCSRERSYEIIATAGNSALCGVTLTPGWYVLESDINEYNNKWGFKHLNLCAFSTAWEDFTYEQYWCAEENRDRCRHSH
ncbi:hypothetical protein ACA910_017832 [Epithemia clementina (nom. ined.)]